MFRNALKFNIINEASREDCKIIFPEHSGHEFDEVDPSREAGDFNASN